jgi:hypothetical protein
MTTNLDRSSAKIYQFPARGRFAADGRFEDPAAAASFASRVAQAALGSSWYHEEAVQEERTRKD